MLEMESALIGEVANGFLELDQTEGDNLSPAFYDATDRFRLWRALRERSIIPGSSSIDPSCYSARYQPDRRIRQQSEHGELRNDPSDQATSNSEMQSHLARLLTDLGHLLSELRAVLSRQYSSEFVPLEQDLPEFPELGAIISVDEDEAASLSTLLEFNIVESIIQEVGDTITALFRTTNLFKTNNHRHWSPGPTPHQVLVLAESEKYASCPSFSSLLLQISPTILGPRLAKATEKRKAHLNRIKAKRTVPDTAREVGALGAGRKRIMAEDSDDFSTFPRWQLLLRRVLPTNAIKLDCPYCLREVDVENEDDWIQHACGDLMPYVCTVGSGQACGRLLFSDRGAWIQHELANHYSSYRCTLCGSTDTTPMEHDAFLEHVRLRHLKEDDDPTKFSIIMDASRIIESREFNQTDCWFCENKTTLVFEPRRVDQPQKYTFAEFMDHVAKHQVDFTLTSLLDYFGVRELEDP